MAHRRLVFGLFAFLFGIYLLTAGGHTYATDEEQMLATTANLITHGSFAIAIDPSSGHLTYSGYGPGQSIAAIPFYLAGKGEWAVSTAITRQQVKKAMKAGKILPKAR